MRPSADILIRNGTARQYGHGDRNKDGCFHQGRQDLLLWPDHGQRGRRCRRMSCFLRVHRKPSSRRRAPSSTGTLLSRFPPPRHHHIVTDLTDRQCRRLVRADVVSLPLSTTYPSIFSSWPPHASPRADSTGSAGSGSKNSTAESLEEGS